MTDDPSSIIAFAIEIEDMRWQPFAERIDAILPALWQYITKKHPYALPKETELSLLLTDDAHIQALNKEYRYKNKPTNVLSFPQYEREHFMQVDYSEPITLLGDIILSFDTVKKESDAQNLAFEDHLIHLLVHGMLHLLGYDHQMDADAEVMEALEIAILAQFNIANPYQTDTEKPHHA